MMVNAFWFGFLIAIVLVIVLFMIIGFINASRREKEVHPIEPEEFKQFLEEITGKKYIEVEDNEKKKE